MKGGYQIIDLSTAEVDSSTTIEGLYDKMASSNGKAILIKTQDGGSVFAKVDQVGASYVSTYIDGQGHSYGVVVTNGDNVTVTEVDGIGDLSAIQMELNNLSDGIENLTNSEGTGRVDELETSVDSYSTDIDNTIKLVQDLESSAYNDRLLLDDTMELSSNLENRVDANRILGSNAVNLTSYNSDSNAYTFQNDGYVHLKVALSSDAGDNIGVSISDKDGGTNNLLVRLMANPNGDQYNVFFVKKGMKVYTTHNVGTGNQARFIPFTN